MNILLLGAGYVGSELLRYLSPSNKIIVLDHGKYFEKIMKSKDINIDNIQLNKGSTLDSDLLDKCMSQADVVINLTGGGGNAACLQNPTKYLNTYITGTQKIVQKAENYEIKHIILSSSIAVYPPADVNELSIVTEETPCHPTSIYGSLKLASERIIEESSLPYTILRFSNIYGYTEFDPIQVGGAIGNFIKSFLDGKDITVYGDGAQKIDYVHIRDVCECIMMILDSDLNRKRIYNAGSGSVKTINEIVGMVLDIGQKRTGRAGKVLHTSAIVSSNSPLMSIDKIKHEIGWHPKVILPEGIEETITK